MVGSLVRREAACSERPVLNRSFDDGAVEVVGHAFLVFEQGEALEILAAERCRVDPWATVDPPGGRATRLPAPAPHERSSMTAGETFTDELEHWLRADRAKTLGSLADVSAEKSFAVTILLLMFVPALPLPTGGVTHVFEVITVVIAAQMVLGRRTMWLPDRWKRRELGSLTTERAIPSVVRWVRRCERFSRPRGVSFFRHRLSQRLLGLLLMGLAVAAALAPPFSGLDTLPAMGAVAIALAIIFEDIVVLAVGVVLGTAGTLLILTIGAALMRLLRDLW
jgi:hypothetical protein